MKTRWRFHSRKVGYRAWQILCSRLYRDQQADFGRSTLVAGVARSGTTWIGDIIASQAPSRIMFEPFNPQLVEAFNDFYYYQYMRPDDENPALHEYCAKLFSGQIRNSWIDHQVTHLAPEYRVVKAVRANLMLKWLNKQFEEVSQVLVIRHPCAIVLSWLQLGWAADIDISRFLQQSDLLNDYLTDKIEYIREYKLEEEKLAIIWCISNLVPLSQFQQGDIHITFYEHMCIQPEIEVPRLFKVINRNYQESVFDFIDIPSTTSRPHSAAVTRQDKVRAWQHKLTGRQVDRILSVVEAFGLEYLYGDSVTPILNQEKSSK